MTGTISDIPDRIDGQITAIRRDLDDLVRFVECIERDLQNEDRGSAGTGTEAGAGIWSLQASLPWLYRGSVLLTLFGFFEHNLNALCDSLRREYGTAIGITDLPGRGLRRAKLYLTRHVGLPFPADTEAWRCLLKYSDIRNLVAHRDSLIKGDDPELARFIEAEPHLRIDASGRIRLEAGALEEVIVHLRRFFEALSECLRGA